MEALSLMSFQAEDLSCSEVAIANPPGAFAAAAVPHSIKLSERAVPIMFDLSIRLRRLSLDMAVILRESHGMR